VKIGGWRRVKTEMTRIQGDRMIRKERTGTEMWRMVGKMIQKIVILFGITKKDEQRAILKEMMAKSTDN
jgi:hypothetical protein